jgi:hypothetical protein
MTRAERQREAIRGRRFGVELELVRITRPAAARIVHETLKGLGQGSPREPWSAGGHYDKWCCLDAQGRTWTFMSDGSVGSSPGASWSGHCEVVTPPLCHEDMPALQAIVRALREGGAKVNNCCGLHVHVEATDLSGPQLRALQLLWSRWEEHFMLAADVHPERLRYCGRSSRRFVQAVKSARPDAMTPEAVRAAWYDRAEAPRREQLQRYDGSRYVALNFHSLTWHGTVELRLWNATLHAGAVRAAVAASVGLVACALTVKRAHGNPVPVNDQSAGNFRQFLLRGLGLTGPENVAVVKHLLAPLQARGMRSQGWARLPFGAGRRGEPSTTEVAAAERTRSVLLAGVQAASAVETEQGDGIALSDTTISTARIADGAITAAHLRAPDDGDSYVFPGATCASEGDGPALDVTPDTAPQADTVQPVNRARILEEIRADMELRRLTLPADLLSRTEGRELRPGFIGEVPASTPAGAVNHNRRVYGQDLYADAAAQVAATAAPMTPVWSAFAEAAQYAPGTDLAARVTADAANRLTAEINREVTEQIIADLTAPPRRSRRPARSAT